ncbi:MAG: tetratricopeptide repeat protein [Nitrospirae bacterium]|nr:tetratricopeptide repeat protein [Nitrospirota bacterium]
MSARHRQIAGMLLALVAALVGCTRATLPAPLPGPAAARADEPRAAEGRKLDQVLLNFQKGITLVEHNKLKDAKVVFEALRTSYPHVSVFHNNLGVVDKRLGLLDEAIASYREAIAIQPAYPEAHYNLAIALREQGQFLQAEKAYRHAIESAPDFRDAHYNLAVLYDLYLNDPEKAIEHYRTYLASGGEGQEEVTIWIAALQKRAERAKEGQ